MTAAALAPEERLVAAASRLGAPPRPSGTVAELAARPQLRWDDLLAVAEWQRVSSLVRHHLGLAQVADRVPATVADRLESTYAGTVARNLRFGAELRQIAGLMGADGIDVMLLKGAALVLGYYPDPGLRPMGDLDLLVHVGDMTPAVAVLEALGYHEMPDLGSPERRRRLRAGHHHWTPMLSADGLVLVELHHRLGAPGGLLDLRLDRHWARAREAPMGMAHCLAPAAEDLLMHVALHFLHHHRSRSYGALGQLADVAVVVDHAGPALDWDVVAGEARASGVEHALLVVLLLTGELQGVTAPPDVLAGLGVPSDHAGFVAEFVRRRVFRPPAWVRLEQLSRRAGGGRQLLPPRPQTLWRAHHGTPAPALRVARTYGEWLRAAAPLVARPGALEEERRFERRLGTLTTAQPAPAR